MSISEVAKRTGVSRSTVSLVINNKPSISSETAQAVRQAMREIGYVPPEKRRGRRPVPETATRIALVAAMPPQVLRAPVYMDVLQGIERRARDAKANLLLFQGDSWDEIDTPRLKGNIDGLICFAARPNHAQLAPLEGLPSVNVMNMPLSVGESDHVTVKHEAVGELAARALLNQGHLHCAQLVVGTDSLWAPRVAAFEDNVRAAGGTVLNIRVVNGIVLTEQDQIVDHEIVSAALDKILAAAPRPTGLYLPVDLFVAPVYLQLLERGIKPGRDIQIVSCNNERSLLAGLRPRPAVVDTHAFEIGQAAVERLLWRIKHPHAPFADILVQPTLIPGG